MGKFPKIIFLCKNRYKEMPLKKYSKGRKIVKRYKKRTSLRRLYFTKKLVRLIKKVSLRNSETKCAYTLLENLQLYHNTPASKQNLLYTQQGIGDTNTGTSGYSTRIGDSVIARGLSLKFWFANKKDRPNVMYRLVVYRYTSGDTISAATDVFNSASSNYMIKDYNTEKIKVLYSKIFNLQVGVSGTLPIGTDNSYYSQREAHRYLRVWIPMKNKILKYDADNSGDPKWSDIGFTIVPYDSYGTLTTDNIASYAYQSKFYFKDP